MSKRCAFSSRTRKKIVKNLTWIRKGPICMQTKRKQFGASIWNFTEACNICKILPSDAGSIKVLTNFYISLAIWGLYQTLTLRGTNTMSCLFLIIAFKYLFCKSYKLYRFLIFYIYIYIYLFINRVSHIKPHL